MKTIFCLALLLCVAHTYSQKGYSIAVIPAGFSEHSNSVLIDEMVETDLTNISKQKEKTHRVVAILNKLGDDDANLYEFYDSNSKVKNIEVYIYNALGKEIAHYKKKDFADISRTGGNMYVDSRMLYLRYTPTTYPYIVVYDSETESGDTAFIRPWYPLNGYAESTLKSTLKIKYNPANKPRYKAQNLEDFDVKISETPEEITFAATNMKTFRYEEQSPPFYDIAPKVNIALDNFELKGVAGSGKDWQQFGIWMEKSLLTDVRDLPEGTLARVKSLVANETTNEGKARKIYQYLQDKVRYISIQIGIGGWKPMLASDVDKLGYGDCKALTNYTKALLDAVGVPSYYTVLYGGSGERNIMSDFASVQGNHVCLGIPDGDAITWLECTSQEKPYGYIGDFTDDRDVLILTPDGGKIAHTKIYSTAESTQESIAKVTVGTQGNISADFNSVSKGLQYDDKYRLPKEKQEDIDKHYKSRWGYLNGVSINTVDFDNDKNNVVFTENVAISIPHYANSVGNDYLFSANIFNRAINIPPRNSDRKQNLFLPHGYIDIDTVEVEFPDNFTVAALPEDAILETKFGKYEMGFSKTSENKIVYHRKLLINKGEYPPEAYKKYREFRRSISRLDKTKILLKQNLQ